jgi:hypothetical protein
VRGLSRCLLVAIWSFLETGTVRAQSSCLVDLEVAGPTTCSECDPNCDMDGTRDDVCTFRVRACVNRVVDGCNVLKLKSVRVTPKRAGVRVTPNGTAPTCGDYADVPVKLKKKGRRAGTLQLKAVARAAGAPRVIGKYRTTLTCNLAPDLCPSTTTSTTTTTVTTTTNPANPNCGNGTIDGSEFCDPAAIPTGCPVETPFCAGGCDRCQAQEACPSHCSNPAGGPARLTLRVATAGTDLDYGWKGNSHNFPLVPNGVLDVCLSECDEAADTTCTACGGIGLGTPNGEVFGAPLPLLTQGTAVCLVNRWRDDIRGTVDEATGGMSLKVLLNSEVYLTDQSAICPQCKGGHCDGGRSTGAACTVDATLPVFISAIRTDQYQLSRQCLPSAPVATLQIDFDPLTSGTSAPLNGPTPCPASAGQITPQADDCPVGGCAEGNCTGLACVTMTDDPTNPGHQICLDAKGGLSQACCVNKTTQPCFLYDASENLTRTGKANPPQPPLPDQTYPKATTGVLASTFCIPATGKSTIDSVTGLPGPGAILLNATQSWTK